MMLFILKKIKLIIIKLENTIKVYRLRSTYNEYLKRFDNENPLSTFPNSLSFDLSASPFEFFSHYESFSIWSSRIIKNLSSDRLTSLSILDLGGLKLNNALLAEDFNVTSLVLADCDDNISRVKYIIQDASVKLRLASKSFDIFTSTVSLQLIGLGRYGDIIDPNGLYKFIGELDRVMKDNSTLIISLAFGNNSLSFNRGYVFDMETIKLLFNKWVLIDFLIDNNSSGYVRKVQSRFTKDIEIIGQDFKNYRVIYLYFRR